MLPSSCGYDLGSYFLLLPLRLYSLGKLSSQRPVFDSGRLCCVDSAVAVDSYFCRAIVGNATWPKFRRSAERRKCLFCRWVHEVRFVKLELSRFFDCSFDTSL